jgi:hypothetical protein
MNKWAITHIHNTPVFYMETQSGRKPHNSFSYMSLRIAFIGSTNFLCFPVATGRRLQPPSFSGYNLRENPTPQFSSYNEKEATTPYVLGYNWKVATTTYPCPVQPPWHISRIMEPLSHYHYEIYCCKHVPINLHHASTIINLYIKL